VSSEVSVTVDVAELIRRKAQALGRSQFELDGQVLKDCNRYCPEADGFLKDSSITASKLGSGELVWDTPYAKAQYHDRPNKSKDKNPYASMKWCEVAKANHLDRWRSAAQRGLK